MPPHMSGMSGAGTPVTAHTLLTDWQLTAFPLAVAVVLVLVAGWYVLRVRALSARGRSWPRSRTAMFLAGLVFVELALGSSVASLTQSTFTAHVTQHLLLMVLAPPLLALGAP